MAKRYPLSRASKAFEAICKAEPLFTAKAAKEDPLNLDSSLLAAFAAKCLREGVFLSGSADKGEAIAALNMAIADDGTYRGPDDLVWVSRWQRCRQVFRIDETVAAELPSTELDDEIPCDVFKRLPYPIVYIERRFKAPLLSGETVDVAGFLAYTVHWAHYWTGKRKGRTDGRYGDELVVRWIPPVPVNEDRGEVTETIHR